MTVIHITPKAVKMKHSLSIPLSVIFLTFFPALSFAKDSNTKEQDKTQAHIETLKDLNQFRAIKKIKADPDMPDWVIYAMKARIALGLEDYEAANKWLVKARQPFQNELSDDVDAVLSPIYFKLLRANGLYDDYQQEILKYGRKHHSREELPKSVITRLEILKFQSQYPQSITIQSEDITIENQGRKIRYGEGMSDDNRMFFTASVNGHDKKFLLDTGAFSTVLYEPDIDKLQITASGISQTAYIYNKSEVTTMPAVLPQIQVGAINFKNAPIVMTPQPDYAEIEEDKFDLLGLPEIQRLGGIEFQINDDTLTGLKVINSLKRDVDEFEHNIFKEYEALFISVKIEDQVYDCNFDTGAVSSYFNRSIYKRHKKSLKLKKIKGRHLNKKPLTRSYLIPAFDNDTYIKEFPVYTGRKQLNLQSVRLYEDGEVATDCKIGIDAIYEAGGGRLDLVNYDVQFGPN